MSFNQGVLLASTLTSTITAVMEKCMGALCVITKTKQAFTLPYLVTVIDTGLSKRFHSVLFE